MKPKDIFPKYKHLGNVSLFFRLPRWHSGYKICLLIQEMRVQSLGHEDPLEKKMATHSSTLAWKIPWTEEPGRLQSMGLQRVGYDWATSLHFTNTDVQINKHYPNENKKSYLFGVCNSRGISHHHLGLAEIQKQAGSEKLHSGEKVRMLCPAWRLLAQED